MLAMHAATDLAIQRAQLHGSSIIAINNIASATGALGWGSLHQPSEMKHHLHTHLGSHETPLVSKLWLMMLWWCCFAARFLFRDTTRDGRQDCPIGMLCAVLRS